MELSDTELAARLLEQRDWLSDLARHLVGDSEAEDLAQETWLAVLRQPGRGDPRAWLAGVARNLARGLRRGRRHRFDRERRSARPEALPSTAELVERLDTEQRLAREIVALREPYRTTVLLRFHEGRSAEEIATSHGIPAGTVRWRTKQGLDELRARLERTFGGREAWGLALIHLVRNPGRAGVTSVASSGGVFMAVKWLAGAAAVASGLVAIVLLRSGSSPGVDVASALPSAAVLARPGGTSAEGAPVAGEATGEGSPTRVELRPTPTETQARLRVLDWNGKALVGARVELRASPGEKPLAVTLDEGGWTALSARVGACELAVERESDFPYLAVLDLRPGDQELHLPRGEVLSGRLVVDGGVPRRPLELELFQANTYTGSGDPFSSGLFERVVARASTDELGAFEFGGLESRAYDLVMPQGHVEPGGMGYRDPYQRLLVSVRPGSGQVLELERYPSVHGRVLRADGTPTAAALDGRVIWRNGSSLDLGAAADEAGEFELFLEREWRELRLDACGTPGSVGCSTHTFSLEQFPDGELGDLRLEEGRVVRLRVLDPERRPIAGAITDLASEPTDKNGETKLLGATRAQLVVAARGFAALQLELPPEDRDELEVELTRAPELSLVVLDAAGAPVPEADVSFTAERALFDGPDGRLQASVWRSDGGRVGRFLAAGDLREGGSYSRFRCDESGRLILGGVLPGVHARLFLTAPGDDTPREEVLLPLGSEERRVLELRLPFAQVRFEGRVVDESGVPVPGARLRA